MRRSRLWKEIESKRDGNGKRRGGPFCVNAF